MKKILALLILFIFMMTTSIVSFSWWDNSLEELDDQSFIIGRGQRLLLYNQSPQTQGLLVPSGSYFSNREGFVSEYRVDYSLTLEQGGVTSDLLIYINDLLVGGLAYNPSSPLHAPFYVSLVVENELLGRQHETHINSAFSYFRIDEIISAESEVKISLIFRLAEQDTQAHDSETLEAAYEFLKNQNVSFNLKFEIPIPE